MKEKKLLAPICIFAYDRPDRLENLFKSLIKSKLTKRSPLFIFIDGPKDNSYSLPQQKCERVAKKFAKNFYSFDIRKSSLNNGLKKSVMSGVTDILNSFDSIIVLEDDLEVSRNFLEYMNVQIKLYKDNLKVGSISGFSTKVRSEKNEYDNYFVYRSTSWGWATWSDRWQKIITDEIKIKKFINDKKIQEIKRLAGDDILRLLYNDFEGKISSWSIYWSFTHLIEGWLVSYPKISKIKNEGFGKESTHTKGNFTFYSSFTHDEVKGFRFMDDIHVENKLLKQFNYYHSNFHKVLSRLMSLFK